MNFQDTFKSFAEYLRDDKELYRAYQSNIAMSFFDAMTSAGYRFPDLHEVANRAASNFLDHLIAKATPTEAQ